MTREEPSKPLKVVIVGAGIGGIACAVECKKKGYDVVMYDQIKDFRRFGDTLVLYQNAGQLLYRWGEEFDRRLRANCGNSLGITLNRWDGTVLAKFVRVPEPGEYPIIPGKGSFSNRPMYDINRADLHLAMFEYAKDLGVECHLGVNVGEYFEENGKAGIIVEGKKIEGDLLIAADGVKSKGRELVFGYYDKPISSGYAIFRAFFPSKRILENPKTSFLITDVPPGGDRREVWIGPDVHFITGCLKNATEFTWKVTHKDIADVEEGWVLPGSIEDALQVIEGWDPLLQEVVKSTPPGHLFDYKLVYRDPLPTWVSKGGHTVLAGDAAHPHLPTSQQGASQAIEDGVTIATCLEMAAQNNVSIPEAMKAYELLRYNRTVATMKLGEEVRNRWHKTDVSNLPTDPEGWAILREKLVLPHHPWLLDHDAKKHAIDHFMEVVNDIRAGTSDKRKYTTEVLRNPKINLDTGEMLMEEELGII